MYIFCTCTRQMKPLDGNQVHILKSYLMRQVVSSIVIVITFRIEYKKITVTQTGNINQPFHDGKQCDSLACIHERISSHNLGMGIYDNSLVNVSSCETSG